MLRAVRVVISIVVCVTVSVGVADAKAREIEYAFRNEGRLQKAWLGPTGIHVSCSKDKKNPKNDRIIAVLQTEKGSPAEGLIKPKEIIVGVNGARFEGLNPFILIGTAITDAEATDGKIVFDIQSKGSVTIKLPVFGKYSPTWPLNCDKSKKIIQQTAEYYGKRLGNGKSLTSAMGYLFLLSTGDDRYLPIVRRYLLSFIDPETKKAAVGTNIWHNGYNGILAGEYYLRTGDEIALPVLQAICDDAKRRQFYGIGWGHWGVGLNPGYGGGGGLMNPASAQVLTSLLLGKECGVKVDDATLLGCLKFFYRFAGHGGVGYGDCRAEGGHGSNGKSGMIAASMQVATGARGDTSIYRSARDVLAMTMLTSYSNIAVGHGDGGMGDAYWRGVSTALIRDRNQKEHQYMMNRLAWWYDLARHANGAMGLALNRKKDDTSYGVGTALAYTAPLKTLRITGAPRSKYAKAFSLPQQLWGTKADLAFHSTTNHPDYFKYGKDEPPHIPLWRLGSAYYAPTVDLKTVPRDEMLKNIYHRRYVIRAQAAKALRQTGRLKDIETLLSHEDPRVRRAALDGIIDYRYFFAIGKSPLKQEQYTPGMIRAIVRTVKNPQESWWVVDGALLAMKNIPAKVIQENLPAILPWTTHEDWWLRQSSFAALTGLEKDPPLYVRTVPTLIEMMIREDRQIPRSYMQRHLNYVLNQQKGRPDDKTVGTKIGRLILDGLRRAVVESEVKEGIRAPEIAWHVRMAAAACLKTNPESALPIARALRKPIVSMDDNQLIRLVGSPSFLHVTAPGKRSRGLFSALETLDEKERRELVDVLYNDYRPELVKRWKEDRAAHTHWKMKRIDTICDLKRLKDKDAGWQIIGSPPAETVWRFTSFDPVREKDKKERKHVVRNRRVTLPEELEGWFRPEYDDSAWKIGKAPIGRGLWKGAKKGDYEYRSDWGDGEFLVMRTTFDLKDVDFDYYRIGIMAKSAYHVYLNGHHVIGWNWYTGHPHYKPWMLKEEAAKHLKKGRNVLAVFAYKEYPGIANPKGWPKTPELGVIDCRIEGLKKSDLEMKIR